MEELKRTEDFERRVANQETSTFKTKDLELMTDEEFAKEIAAMGPAQAAEAKKIREMSADKRRGSGPAREINK